MIVTVTHLEMLSASEILPRYAADPAFSINEATIKQWQVNKFFYSFVGESWSWWEKLSWNCAQWQAYAHDNRLRTWIASYAGSPAGYFELRRDEENGVEISYLGLTSSFIGHGLGGPLLTGALLAAWAEHPKRVWVHTCTLDHPAALANYLARGMKIFRTELQNDPPKYSSSSVPRPKSAPPNKII